MNRMQRRQAEIIERARKKERLIEENKGIERRLKQAQEEMHEEIGHYYMGVMYTAFILVLRRAYGFGPKRITRALDELAAIVNDLDAGTIDIADLKRAAEEAGLEIKFDSNRNFVEVNLFEEKNEVKKGAENVPGLLKWN